MSPGPRRPCIFYQRNACSFGDACLYLHSTSAPTPAPTTSPVCPHFLLGRCRFGDQCRQLHPAPAQADLPSSDKSSGLAAPPCWYFKHSSCTKGADCAFSHGSGEVPPALFDTPRDHRHLVDHREIKQAAESNWRNRENPVSLSSPTPRAKASISQNKEQLLQISVSRFLYPGAER